jgi:hypothetical protein
MSGIFFHEGIRKSVCEAYLESRGGDMPKKAEEKVGADAGETIKRSYWTRFSRATEDRRTLRASSILESGASLK